MESGWISGLKVASNANKTIDKTASVVFRWCRTVSTKGNPVIFLHLQPDPPPIDPQEVTLSWNSTWRHYESSTVDVPCGHFGGSRLVIDNVHYPCEPFAITPNSFEVNLFLEEDAEEDWSLGMATSSRGHREVYSDMDPIKRTFSWSGPPKSFGQIMAQEMDTVTNDSERTQMDILYRLLRSRDEEIAQLKLEVAHLRTVINEMLQNQGKPQTEFSDRDAAESTNEDEFNMRDEMKLLREELEATCSKNEDLSKEMAILREENMSLRRVQIKDALNTDEDTSIRLDSVFSSVSDTPRKEPREKNYQLVDSIATSVTSDEEEFLSSVFGKMKSGVQTDITALFGDPSFYSENEKLSGLQKAKKLTANRSQYRKRNTHTTYNRDGGGSDTDELLEEAQEYLNGHSNDQGNQGLICSVTQWTLKSTEKPRPKSNMNLPFLPKSPKDIKLGATVKYLGYGGRMSQGKVASVDAVGDMVTIETQFRNEISKVHGGNAETVVPFKKIVLVLNS